VRIARAAFWTASALGLWALCLAACSPRPPTAAPAVPDRDWPFYGADEGGQRFSRADQITPANVRGLRVAWSFSTGDLAARRGAFKHAAFEDTPLMVGGRLFVTSPFNAVFALDPASGRTLWRYDPRIDVGVSYGEGFTSRGVAYWRVEAAPARSPCAERLFVTTNDRRLIALDAATGRPCAGFGKDGVVDVGAAAVFNTPSEMQITSPPVVSRGVVVVGSAIVDNITVKAASGAVRAFDAVTGAPKWRYDPLADARPAGVMGAGNVWAPMSTDTARGLVFLPTSSPSPDYWGGLRKGNNGDADSVVALDIATGRRVWAFQVVHHDVWDYDIPAQPTLATVTWAGRTRPAVLEPTKQGLLFTLDRESGAPLIPVEERPVPQGGAPGEALSPTQPFPIAPRPLSPSTIRPQDAFGLFPWEKVECRRQIAAARHEGLFTPPSVQGAIVYPFTGGGANWGGLAFDPGRQIAYVNTSSAMHLVTLIPAARYRAERSANPYLEMAPQTGAPFGVRIQTMLSSLGLPCNPTPWGQLHAIDMRTGKVLWEAPLGTTADVAPGSQWLLGRTGTPNFGGPIVTASGLVFIGAAMDDYLRAFDAASGRELWRGRLPAGGQATPMTYVWKGRQYVLIAAGGHAKTDTRRGDRIIAFALPSPRAPTGR
jgi:quinoprotein glucose dehydrogenase